MRKGALLFAAAGLALLCIQPARAEILTGNLFYEACEDKAGRPDYCLAYVIGATQMYVVLHADTLCSRPGTTGDQILDVTVKLMRDEPERRNELAPIFIVRALSKIYACPDQPAAVAKMRKPL